MPKAGPELPSTLRFSRTFWKRAHSSSSEGFCGGRRRTERIISMINRRNPPKSSSSTADRLRRVMAASCTLIEAPLILLCPGASILCGLVFLAHRDQAIGPLRCIFIIPENESINTWSVGNISRNAVYTPFATANPSLWELSEEKKPNEPARTSVDGYMNRNTSAGQLRRR